MPEPHDGYEHPTVHAADECLLSKKLENHAAAVALHHMHYNFCRVHQTLRVTPAMEAGLSNRVWDVADVVALLVADTSKAA